MSLITDAFGESALTTTKQEIIAMIRSNPAIDPGDRPKYLQDWSVATVNPINGLDIELLMK